MTIDLCRRTLSGRGGLEVLGPDFELAFRFDLEEAHPENLLPACSKSSTIFNDNGLDLGRPEGDENLVTHFQDALAVSSRLHEPILRGGPAGGKAGRATTRCR